MGHSPHARTVRAACPLEAADRRHIEVTLQQYTQSSIALPSVPSTTVMFALTAYPISFYVLRHFFLKYISASTPLSFLFAASLSCVPLYVHNSYYARRDGKPSSSIQKWEFWTSFMKYFTASINVEEPLDDSQLYIFCAFPHGACTANHMMTMTNSCQMLSKHYRGEKRDLAASILFSIPFVGELLLLLGCVDASASTANYNLTKGRSLLVFVGGEKEQLMTEQGKHKIFLSNRKGFVKLAITYGAALVPMVSANT